MSGADEVATAVERLCVVLEAGVAPTAALRLVARRSRGTVRAVLTAAAESEHIPRTLREDAPEPSGWNALAAVWQVAEQAGAGLTGALAMIAECLREQAEREREVRAALAGPMASARLVLLMPLVGLLLCSALDIPVWTVLVGTVAGWVCLGVAGGLLWAAQRWMRRLVRTAQPDEVVPGLPLVLTAIGLAGGLDPGAAMRRARLAARVAAWDDAALLDTLDLAEAAGASARPLLLAEATRLRREVVARDRERVARLGVHLLLPLGICVLPAFIALTVVPAVLGLFSSTATGLVG